jgi:putative membrane protein
MRSITVRRRRSTWKGVTAGLLGGLAGTVAMTLFQRAWSQISEKVQSDNSSNGDQSEDKAESEDATMKAAGKLSSAVLGMELSHEQKKKFGPVVHYSFGTLTGGVYGGIAENIPQVRQGLGIPFGTAVFLGADELTVPALGLSGSPTESPLSTHAYSLASHAVYGVTTELVRRSLRRLF